MSLEEIKAACGRLELARLGLGHATLEHVARELVRLFPGADEAELVLNRGHGGFADQVLVHQVRSLDNEAMYSHPGVWGATDPVPQLDELLRQVHEAGYPFGWWDGADWDEDDPEPASFFLALST